MKYLILLLLFLFIPSQANTEINAHQQWVILSINSLDSYQSWREELSLFNHAYDQSNTGLTKDTTAPNKINQKLPTEINSKLPHQIIIIFENPERIARNDNNKRRFTSIHRTVSF